MTRKCAHLPGALTQRNKPFKSKHSTKGDLKRSHKKKKNVASPHNPKVNLSKEERKNRAEQIKKLKKEHTSVLKQLGGSNNAPPKLVGLVCLSDMVGVDWCYDMLLDVCGVSAAQKKFWAENCGHAPIPLIIPRFKSRINLWKVVGDVEFILDAMKVCDIAVFVFSMNEEPFDAKGRLLIDALLFHGIPTCFGVAVKDARFNAKMAAKMRKHVFNEFQKKFTTDSKCLMLEDESDALNLIRQLGVNYCKKFWRDNWSYMLANRISWDPYDEGDRTFGMLSITGYIRGNDFDCNSLIYMNGIGEFQVDSVYYDTDKFPFSKNGMKAYDSHYNYVENDDNSMIIDEEGPIVKSDPSLVESLQQENPVLENFPSNNKPKIRALKYKKVRVPKGTGIDQAYWYCYNSDDDGSEDDVESLESASSSTHSENRNPFLCDESDEDSQWVQYDDKNKDIALEDDEIECPEDGQLIQDVYREYRSLKSFRTSPWDPLEDLPLDYSRIFQFKNFNRAQKNIISIIRKDPNLIKSGSFVKIKIKDVHQSALENFHSKNIPWIFVNLHPFENKISIMNFLINRCNEETAQKDKDPIRSFESFNVEVGFRKFSLSLCFSEHNPKWDKHKLLKVLPDNEYCIASAYAPITFTPAPVLVWNHQKTSFILAGSIYSCDPNRIILDRIMLTGRPHSVEGHRLVVKEMFNNPADVRYFQKVELTTKKGINGRITESLGTKGHFKAIFSGKVSYGDKIHLPLYKRVFPKWTSIPQPQRVQSAPGNGGGDDDDFPLS